jgi:hypothetical protein
VRKQPSRAFAAKVSAALSLLFLGSCVLVFDYGDYRDPTGGQAASSGGGGASGSSSGMGGGPVSCDPGATVDCYSGPVGTDGLGLCKRGTATCDADGMGIGVCMGEVTPALEVPANDLDEDCDKHVSAKPEWAFRFGGPNEQNLQRVAFNPDVGLFIAGWFQEGINLGGGKQATRALSEGSGWYVASLNPENGDARWITPSPDLTRDSFATGIAPTLLKNVYVAGYLGVGEGVTGEDGFLVQLNMDDGSIAPNWTKTISGTGAANDRVAGVAANMGNIYVAANFENSLTIPTQTDPSKGKHDIAVVSYNIGGAPLWTRTFGGMEDDIAQHIAISASEQVAVTGAYREMLHNGMDAITPPAGAKSDIFVLFLETDGTFRWARGFVDSSDGSDIEGKAVSFDHEGNVVVVGRMSGTVDCSTASTDVLTSAGGYDVFVAKLGQMNGELLWCKRFGATKDQEGTGVTIDQSGDIYVSGTFDSEIKFDPEIHNLTGTGQNMFVAKLDPSGAVVWTMRFGDTEPIEPRSIQVSGTPEGAVFLGGAWKTALNFGTSSGMLEPGPDAGLDVFIANFSF